MRQLPTWEFDAYALSLPRGHGFGDAPPAAAFLSDDGTTWATICQGDDGTFSWFVMRRRVDRVWRRVGNGGPYQTQGDAFVDAVAGIDDSRPPEPLPGVLVTAVQKVPLSNSLKLFI